MEQFAMAVGHERWTRGIPSGSLSAGKIFEVIWELQLTQ